jgi:hypothetical protein
MFRGELTGPGTGPPPVVAEPLAQDFGSVAKHWCHEYFVEANRAGPDREQEVRRQIDLHLLPYLAEVGVGTGSELTREEFKGFLVRFAHPRRPTTAYALDATLVAGGPGEGWFSIKQAVRLTGRSLATIKRRLHDDAFPRAHRVGAQWSIPGGDLVTAGLLAPGAGRRGRRPRGAYSQGSVDDLRRILTHVLLHGRDTVGWTLQFDPTKVTKVRSRVPARPAPQPISLAETARIAESLHAVHQTVLWLCRILGLRISEAYGIQLRDVVDLGDRGILHVRGQGGRWFLSADGANKVARRDSLKNAQSGRVLVIPRHLMVLIRAVIAAFHTGDDGAPADPTTRLIPGLGIEDAGGQASFRAALRTAATERGIDLGSDLSDPLPPTPHDLRKGITSDLTWTDLPIEIRKRFAGHAIGNDVHSRTYALDHPSRAPMRTAAEAVEALLDAELPAGLLTPTTVRCTTRAQVTLADRADQIDAVLIDAGWLVLPGTTVTLLDAAQIAPILDIAEGTARRWLRDGHVPARPIPGARRDMLGATLHDVLALRDHLATRRTLTGLAEDLHVNYHVLYGWADRRGLPLSHDHGTICVPEDTEQALRDLKDLRDRLTRDGLTLREAATELGLPARTIEAFARTGRLTLLHERGPDGARYLTRQSVTSATAGESPSR